jgi:hypothetical protein
LVCALLIILARECLLIGATGTGVASVEGLSNLTNADTVFIEKQEKITKSFFSATVAVNGLCTRSSLLQFHFSFPHSLLTWAVSPFFFAVLIAYRLWTRQHTIRDSRKAFGFTREAAIMAESGAIYSATLIIIISTYATQSNSFNVFLDMVSKPFFHPSHNFFFVR